MKKKNCCNIGGQAVLEGVMMRGTSSMAIAVRDNKGEIVMESSHLTPAKEKPRVYRMPIIRGMISFFSSMVTGMKIINRSSEVFGDMSEEAPSRFEKWLAKTFKLDIMTVVIAIGAILGILFSVALFVFIPQLITTGIFSLAKLSTQGFGMSVVYNLIAGAIRMGIFIGYIAAITCVKDVKRLFMYHGAEHKTISCYENGMELTVENAQKMTTIHDRCGTTFMFIVMAFSILFFAAFPIELVANAGAIANFFIRVLSRIIMIPLVAGISYEFLKLFSYYDNKLTRILKKPGMWLQKLTTKEPDDSMVEVAIAAFNEVLALEADKNYSTKTFITYKTVEKTVKDLESHKITENEAELILCNLLKADKKSDLYDGRRVDSETYDTAIKYAKRRAKGAPLQYVMGKACFYGYDITVNENTLIPRFDTEVIAEKVINLAKQFDNPKILDLCTGSGAIAIAVQKNSEGIVVATDISKDAIEVAKTNAQILEAKVDFRVGSLFMPIRGETFDIIVSNPPYIQSLSINELDKEVADYEPRLALDGGADGLDFYRDIAKNAEKYINNGGYLVLEVGINQAEEVAKLLNKFEIEYIYDYNNPPIKRGIVAKIVLEEK